MSLIKDNPVSFIRTFITFFSQFMKYFIFQTMSHYYAHRMQKWYFITIPIHLKNKNSCFMQHFILLQLPINSWFLPLTSFIKTSVPNFKLKNSKFPSKTNSMLIDLAIQREVACLYASMKPLIIIYVLATISHVCLNCRSLVSCGSYSNNLHPL